jgi:hypothetical protein
MFLSAKKDQIVPMNEELKRMKEKVPGPFLQAKKQIQVSEEFKMLLKKFEKRFKTPIRVAQVKESDLSTVKVERQKTNKQLKIVNVFNNQKVGNSKSEKV